MQQQEQGVGSGTSGAHRPQSAPQSSAPSFAAPARPSSQLQQQQQQEDYLTGGSFYPSVHGEQPGSAPAAAMVSGAGGGSCGPSC